MDLSTAIRKEWDRIDKRRTGGLLGFLIILAFFPIFLSSSDEQRISRSEAATIPNQTDAPVAAQQQGQPSGQPAQGQPGQPSGQPSQAQPSGQPQQGTGQQQAAQLTPQIAYPAPEQAPYSPQPSIWLFLIPVAVTFFTILFY